MTVSYTHLDVYKRQLLCGAAQAVLGDAANTLTSFVLLACAIVIELVVLSIVKARMGHTGKEEVTKS